jgi:hypothetical protein
LLFENGIVRQKENSPFFGCHVSAEKLFESPQDFAVGQAASRVRASGASIFQYVINLPDDYWTYLSTASNTCLHDCEHVGGNFDGRVSSKQQD